MSAFIDSESSSSRSVGRKSKAASQGGGSVKVRASESQRWFWVLHYDAELASSSSSGVGYNGYPAAIGEHAAVAVTSGPKPRPLNVTFVSFQEEVCPETKGRHIQGYIEVGTYTS